MAGRGSHRARPVESFGGFLRADALSALVAGLNALVALACGIYAVGYLRQEQRLGRINAALLHRYYALTPVFVGTMMAVPLLNNLGLLWVAIESTTLASVLLVRYYNQKSSLEAAWKYIIIGSAGIALALLGTVLVYSSAVQVPGLRAEDGFNWSALIQVADQCQPSAMRLGFVLVLVGYGTKAGLAPMHTWKPDAYAEAPVPSAALLGAAFINCAIYGIMRFYALAARCLGHEYTGHLLVIFGVASILIAAPFVLIQRNFRRLLAYSSIDHAGIMVAALGFGGGLGPWRHAAHGFSFRDKTAAVFLRGQRATALRLAAFPQDHRRHPHAALDGRAVSGRGAGRDRRAAVQLVPERVSGVERGAGGGPPLGGGPVCRGHRGHFRRVPGPYFPAQSRPARARRAPGAEGRWKLGAMLLVAAPVVALGQYLPAPLYQLARNAAQTIGGTP